MRMMKELIVVGIFFSNYALAAQEVKLECQILTDAKLILTIKPAINSAVVIMKHEDGKSSKLEVSKVLFNDDVYKIWYIDSKFPNEIQVYRDSGKWILTGEYMDGPITSGQYNKCYKAGAKKNKF